jgi:hypothetical protein
MHSAYTLLYMGILLFITVIIFIWLRDTSGQENFATGSRSCDTYFVPTNQIRACDKGYFAMEFLKLEQQKKALENKGNRTAQEEQDLADMVIAYDERQKSNGAIQYCKFSWPDMVQRADLEKDALKNSADPNTALRNGSLADGSPNPDSGDWAFCYSSVTDLNSGNTKKQAFGDKGSVAADVVLPQTNSPFDDNQHWLRYQFKRLDRDSLKTAFCSLDPTPLPSNFPEVLVALHVNRTTMEKYEYSIMQNKDFPGNDIQCFGDGSTVDKCLTACDNDTNCKGVVEVPKNSVWGEGSGCCYKHQLANEGTYQGLTFYSKNGLAPQNNNGNLKISDLSVHVTRTGARIQQYASPNDVFRKLVELYFNTTKNALCLREKARESATVRVLDFDPCGRIKLMNSLSIPLNGNAFGVPEVIIQYISDPNIFKGITTGVDGLNATLAELNQSIADKQTQIENWEANNNKITYLSGVKVNEYNVNPKVIQTTTTTPYYYTPNGNNAADMTAIFANATFQSVFWANRVNFNSSPLETCYIIQGFLHVANNSYLKPGQYQFLLNSDDGSDMTLNGTMVSTHYGYHGQNNQGIVVTTMTLQTGNHPFNIRFFQWRGGSGLSLKYKYRENSGRSWSSWRDFHNNSFRYNAPSYWQGVVFYKYKVNHRVTNVTTTSTRTEAPPANNANDMNAIFTNGVSLRTANMIHNTMNISNVPIQRGYIIQGELVVSSTGVFKPGYYQFKLNSDDASDMTVKNNIVSHHYGYHGQNNNGISVNPSNNGWYLGNGRHPYQIRFFNWHGPGGLSVKYRRKQSFFNSWSSWQDIPANVLQYEGPASNYTSQITVATQEIADMNAKIKEINELVATFAHIPDIHVTKLFQQVIGKTIGSLDTMANRLSNDGKIYMDYGITAASVPIIG